MLKGMETDCAFLQLIAIFPFTGTFSCMFSVGLRRSITVVDSPYSSGATSVPVTHSIQFGITMLMSPVVPLPILVRVIS